MRKPSQKEIVLKQMRETGSLTRNWCLQRFITRLGAIICTLKKEGMDISAEFKEGDYVYKLNSRPKSITEYRVEGKLIHTKLTW